MRRAYELQALEAAAQIYADQRGPLIAWLEGRGLPVDAALERGMGFAPRYELLRRLHPDLRHGAEIANLLGVRDSGTLYERLVDRVTIPIRDRAGRVVAIAGRDVTGAAVAKFLTCAAADWYHKPALLYGFGEARRCMPTGQRGSRVWVVEGYFDALALCSVGLPAVALCGTSLGPAQVAQLGDLGAEAVLVLDGDAAGEAGALAGARALVCGGMRARVVTLDAGQDPDDVVLAGGAAALGDRLQDAPTAWRYLVEGVLAAEYDDTPAAMTRVCGALGAAGPAAHRMDAADFQAGVRAIVDRSARGPVPRPVTELMRARNWTWPARPITSWKGQERLIAHWLGVGPDPRDVRPAPALYRAGRCKVCRKPDPVFHGLVQEG